MLQIPLQSETKSNVLNSTTTTVNQSQNKITVEERVQREILSIIECMFQIPLQSETKSNVLNSTTTTVNQSQNKITVEERVQREILSIIECFIQNYKSTQGILNLLIDIGNRLKEVRKKLDPKKFVTIVTSIIKTKINDLSVQTDQAKINLQQDCKKDLETLSEAIEIITRNEVWHFVPDYYYYFRRGWVRYVLESEINTEYYFNIRDLVKTTTRCHAEYFVDTRYNQKLDDLRELVNQSFKPDRNPEVFLEAEKIIDELDILVATLRFFYQHLGLSPYNTIYPRVRRRKGLTHEEKYRSLRRCLRRKMCQVLEELEARLSDIQDNDLSLHNVDLDDLNRRYNCFNRLVSLRYDKMNQRFSSRYYRFEIYRRRDDALKTIRTLTKRKNKYLNTCNQLITDLKTAISEKNHEKIKNVEQLINKNLKQLSTQSRLGDLKYLKTKRDKLWEENFPLYKQTVKKNIVQAVDELDIDTLVAIYEDVDSLVKNLDDNAKKTLGNQTNILLTELATEVDNKIKSIACKFNLILVDEESTKKINGNPSIFDPMTIDPKHGKQVKNTQSIEAIFPTYRQLCSFEGGLSWKAQSIANYSTKKLARRLRSEMKKTVDDLISQDIAILQGQVDSIYQSIPTGGDEFCQIFKTFSVVKSKYHWLTAALFNLRDACTNDSTYYTSFIKKIAQMEHKIIEIEDNLTTFHQEYFNQLYDSILSSSQSTVIGHRDCELDTLGSKPDLSEIHKFFILTATYGTPKQKNQIATQLANRVANGKKNIHSTVNSQLQLLYNDQSLIELTYKARIEQLNQQSTTGYYRKKRYYVSDQIEAILKEENPYTRIYKLIELYQEVDRKLFQLGGDKTKNGIKTILVDLIISILEKNENIVKSVIEIINSHCEIEPQYACILQEIISRGREKGCFDINDYPGLITVAEPVKTTTVVVSSGGFFSGKRTNHDDQLLFNSFKSHLDSNYQDNKGVGLSITP